MMEYDQKCFNRIQSFEAWFGVCAGVREYNLEYGSTAGVWEYGGSMGVRREYGSTAGVWEYGGSMGVLSKALQYQNIQMTVYLGRVQKFYPAINILIIIYFFYRYLCI